MSRTGLGSEALIDWFWTVGHQRQGRYALGTGTWLDNAYRLKSIERLAKNALASKRRSVALWGPSQAGKSTLLSRYLDSRSPESAPSLPHSALQWSEREPVVFLGREDTPPGCVQLNPYNQGADASGCVSRFVLEETVEDPVHPVELRLASEAQILHSLAAGFLSECDQLAGQTQEIFFTSQSVDDLLARYSDGAQRPLVIVKLAYERLRQVADILEDLISGGWPRYSNLHSSWEALRARLLGQECLLASPELVDDFAAKLFWNGEEKITALFQQLRQIHSQIGKLVGNRSITCSFAVAKLFLNINSYQECLGNPVQSDGFDIRYSLDAFRIRLDHSAPTKLFANPSDFGLWQALAWELVFPVRAAAIAQTAPHAAAFLKEADLQDFPGVALAMAGGVRKPANQMTPEELLTKVLKRGKTASVVAHRARELGIDSFCLLIRMSTPPAQPDQLIHGIQAWLTAFNLPLPPASREVPLNLVLTFGAKVINDEIFQLRNNRPKGNFDNVFGWLDQLGPLTAPGWPTYFATTYPQWTEGRIDGKPIEMETVFQDVIQHSAFTSRFGQQSESIKAMFLGGFGPDGDGGINFLLQNLTQQARSSRVPQLLGDRQRRSEDNLRALINEALPLDDFEQRKADLEAWKNGIREGIRKIRAEEPEGDAARRVSLLLRQLLNVDPRALESLPLQCASTDVGPYIGRQFNAHWLQSRRNNQNGWAIVGLKDQASTERLLSYLCEYALRDGSLAKWLRHDLGQITQREEADHARRFLATKMGDVLCFGTMGRKPHRPFEGATRDGRSDTVESRLAGYVMSEALSGVDRKDEDSPHFTGFIAGFLDHLDSVAKSTPGQRPSQPGDEDLRRLRNEACPV